MIPALWISKTGLDAQQMHVGIISNNLANVSTTGYKKSRPVFEDLLYQNLRQPGGQTTATTELPTGLMLGTGVKIVSTQKNFQDGNLQQTDNQLDISIRGKGFLQITRTDGTLSYTRDGALQLNKDGQLVNSSGLLLSPVITIPTDATSVSIGTDGTVSATTAGTTTSTTLGQIQIADFINPAGLLPIGENQFQETTASGTPQVGTPGEDSLGFINQHTLEASNVNVVEELVKLIEAQRAYEMNSKAISTVDGMLQFASQQI